MQTQRLQSLTTPGHVEHLLETYVTMSSAVPPAAARTRDWTGLPVDIRHLAARATADGCTCLAWTHGDVAWLFAASIAMERSREFGRPVLDILAYDSIGRTRSCVVAMRLPDGAWRDCVDA